MTSELADVGIERMDGVVVATVSGEIDMSNAARVRQRIAEFVTPEDWAVDLDLSGLTFIDSAGLHGVSSCPCHQVGASRGRLSSSGCTRCPSTPTGTWRSRPRRRIG